MPHKTKEARRAYLKALSAIHPRNPLHKALGITRERYFELLEAQNWVCAICQRTPRKAKLDLDHDHSTGQFRGFLCKGCNTALGKFQDSPELLQRAIDYLRAGGVR